MTSGGHALAEAVYDSVADAWFARGADLATIASIGSSFEEWATWEALFACRRTPSWRVAPRHSYRTFGVRDTRGLGDLLVTEGGASVLVEVGIVHDWTYPKWAAKLRADTGKLARLGAVGVAGLQVILRVSAGRRGASQQAWLPSVPAWTASGLPSRILDLGDGTNIEVRGSGVGS